MKWSGPELVAFIAKMDGKMSDDLRLVMIGIQHIDARIGHLQVIGYYASAILTALLVAILVM